MGANQKNKYAGRSLLSQACHNYRFLLIPERKKREKCHEQMIIQHKRDGIFRARDVADLHGFHSCFELRKSDKIILLMMIYFKLVASNVNWCFSSPFDDTSNFIKIYVFNQMPFTWSQNLIFSNSLPHYKYIHSIKFSSAFKPFIWHKIFKRTRSGSFEAFSQTGGYLQQRPSDCNFASITFSQPFSFKFQRNPVTFLTRNALCYASLDVFNFTQQRCLLSSQYLLSSPFISGCTYHLYQDPVRAMLLYLR